MSSRIILIQSSIYWARKLDFRTQKAELYFNSCTKMKIVNIMQSRSQHSNFNFNFFFF